MAVDRKTNLFLGTRWFWCEKLNFPTILLAVFLRKIGFPGNDHVFSCGKVGFPIQKHPLPRKMLGFWVPNQVFPREKHKHLLGHWPYSFPKNGILDFPGEKRF